MGIRNVFLPSLATASSLYWMPPTGPIEPSGLMVPVNATSDFMSWPRTPETNDAVISPPALGPSMKPFVSHEMRKLLMSLPVSNAPPDVGLEEAHAEFLLADAGLNRDGERVQATLRAPLVVGEKGSRLHRALDRGWCG